MVSGETIVRDLQLGIARARRRSAARCGVGYLPDMFGHVAQMPQILRLAGLEHAVVWRGVPRAIDRTAFWWAGARRLARARRVPLRLVLERARPPARPRRSSSPRARGYEAELGPAALPGGGMLLMNGSDHLLPQPLAGRASSRPRTPTQDDYQFAITSLAEYLARATDRRPPHVVRRAALRRARQRADGRGVEPGRRAPGRGRTPSARSSDAPSH